MNDDNTGKFQGQYRIASARLAGYDYGANGMYFITICTKERQHFFGEINTNADQQCALTPTIIGQRAIDGWLTIPQYAPFARLDAFQVMPNHLHGIVWICKSDYTDTDWQPNRFGVQRQNLPAIVQGFKAGVTAFARKNDIEFGWLSRYYDRIIRNDDELNRIRHYIENNPANWHQDHNNPDGMFM